MTPDPHPSDIDLAAFAAAKLDETQRDVIVAHVRGCARCRAFVSTIEHAGGIILDSLPPTPLADGSLTEVMARIDRLAAAADLPVFVPRSRPGAPASSALIRRLWFRPDAPSAFQDGAGDSCAHHPVPWDHLSGWRICILPQC